MHRNIILIIPSILFSLLFYKQSLGLNYSLFSILVIGLLVIYNFEKFKHKETSLYASFYLIASSFVFVYNSTLTILASTIVFFVLLGSLTSSKSSLYIKLINGFYSTIASSFVNYYNHLLEETEAVKKRKINYLYWFKMIGIPIVVLVVFIILYRSANPYFDEIVSRIDLSFINLQWILFTLIGYLLLLNINNPQKIQPITETDLNTPNQLKKEELKKQSNVNLLQENKLGIILLVLLNLLIGFFLITDSIYITSLVDLAAANLSKAVHEGVYALIASIVFAIIIILYLFRGNLNFYEKNRPLKILTIIWISLNIILVLITTYKNYLYVTHHGLTYKRIGVFIYLSLSLVGLLTTYIKVYAQNNLWYLFRMNISVAFLMLVISTTINWDRLITNYNIVYAQIVDLNYLINLSDNNALLLHNFSIKKPSKPTIEQARRIKLKYKDYTAKLNKNSWQELVYDNLKQLK
jgi:hypothetical protein